MTAYSTADWLFIGFILIVIAACVAISARIQRTRSKQP